jgi:hypothetical protein
MFYRRIFRLRAREKLLILLIVGVLIYTGLELFRHDHAGPDYIEPPQQTVLDDRREIGYKGKDGPVTLVLLAEYDITGVVRSRRNYTGDAASSVSPMDLVLAWGNLNKNDIEDLITFSQSGRWYYYYVRENPSVSLYDVQTQSSNDHIIPADGAVLRQLKKIGKYDIVELHGYLVSVIFDSRSEPWNSSLSREDSGDRSCEIMYVTSVIIKEQL